MRIILVPDTVIVKTVQEPERKDVIDVTPQDNGSVPAVITALLMIPHVIDVVEQGR